MNPRATFRPPAVFKTAPFDRSGTPPNHIVAEVAFARVRSHRQGLAPNGACPNNRFLDSPCGDSPSRP